VIAVLAACGIVIAVQVVRGDLSAGWLWAEAIAVGWIAASVHYIRPENDPEAMREVAGRLAGSEPLLLFFQVYAGAGIDSVVVATDKRITHAQPGRGQAAPEILWSIPYDEITSLTGKGHWEDSERSVSLTTAGETFEVALPGKADEKALTAIWTQHRERPD
jgi:hypothetical protein